MVHHRSQPPCLLLSWNSFAQQSKMLSSTLALGFSLLPLALATPYYPAYFPDNCTSSQIVTAAEAPVATITTITTTNATATATIVQTKPRGRLLPTHTPNRTIETFDLSTSLTNQELPIPNLPLPLRCIDCHTTGSLEFFVRNAEDTDTSFWDDFHFDESDWPGPAGSLVARFPQGLQGTFELGLSAPRRIAKEIELMQLSPLGVSVPGIGKAGLLASLVVPLELEFDAETDISFGFNFSLPRNASVAVHFPFVEKSTAYGFKESQGLKIDSLPLSLSTPGLDVKLTTGLRLKLEVEVSSDDDDYVVGTGATLDLPRVVVKEEQLVNVDDTCRALSPNISTAVSGSKFSSSNMTASNLTHSLEDLVGDYTHIKPSIGVNMGLFAEVEADVVFDINKSYTTDLLNVAWPLPTACIDNGRSSSTSAAAMATSTMSLSPRSSSMPSYTQFKRAPRPTVMAAEANAASSVPRTGAGACVVSLVLALVWGVAVL